MNDKEIKEILDRLDFNEWEVDLYKVPNTWCELYNIRDYITNLQSNWNSLREWVERMIQRFIDIDNLDYVTFQAVRDKMNELEGKDNNGTMDKKSKQNIIM